MSTSAAPPPLRVCIVGAGAAGIVTAATIEWTLRAFEATHSVAVTLLEREHDVECLGGIWAQARIHGGGSTAGPAPSPVYPFLRANLPTCLMESPLLPWSESGATEVDDRSYPEHAAIAAYVTAVCERYNVTPRIRFGVDVTDIRILGSSGAVAVTARGGASSVSVDEYDRVVVCTGRFREALLPAALSADALRTQFAESSTADAAAGTVLKLGRVRHVSDIEWDTFDSTYAAAAVLLVGAGSSGRDVLLRLASVATLVCWTNARLRARYGCVDAFESAVRRPGARVVTARDVAEALGTLRRELRGTGGRTVHVILATGYDTTDAAMVGALVDDTAVVEFPGRNVVAAAAPQYGRRAPLVAMVGGCSVLCPLAQLFDEALQWASVHLAGAIDAPPGLAVSAPTPQELRVLRAHASDDAEGELPFTAYSASGAHRLFDAVQRRLALAASRVVTTEELQPATAPPELFLERARRLQHTFDLCEARLRADFVTYRDDAAFAAALARSVNRRQAHCCAAV